ncbi:MAG: tandem-95 repeat protein [Sphingomonadales bacterium]|nr:MAG: tandem-95 repeat protein [Sphingomonadales bacterium]
MDAFDNPARNGMTGPERDGVSNEQSNRAAPSGEFLAAAANVTAAASIIPLAIQAILVPDASGRIILPAGASIDDITISGTDLVITLPNGQIFIIPGGAVDVPAIVVDGDTVPASTVAQLLENLGELNPEAGVRSSGGNFADPEGPIQDAYALGDLLPYTQLAFPQPEERELLPAVSDEEPTISIVTPDQPAGIAAATASVNEAGLPARGGEPAGSNSAASSETTTGSIVYDAGDGLDALTINGTAITAVGQVITTPLGQLTITSLTPGNVGYSYTLTDNTNANNNLTDPFTVVVTDNDGDTASATLTISVVDDVPAARNDTDQIAAGSFVPETGNVLTGTGTTSGLAGADTPGADGASLTGIRGSSSEGGFSAPGTVQGQYGTLTINAQGGYTYVRNPGTPGGVNDVFSYQITDGDGDTSTATLTISIADAPTVITFVPGDGDGDGGTVVYEADLGPREGETPGSAFAGGEGGSDASTSGTITFTAVDGVGSVSIGGVTLTPGSLPQTISSDTTGTLVVTGYSFDPATGAGSVTYVYTLIDNILDGDGTTVSFPLVITDADGDAATDTLDINIVDDMPTARADSDSVTEDGPTVADGNVLTGSGGEDANGTDGVADVQGADGATITAVTGGTVGEPLAGSYGSLTLNADGSYSYALNNEAQAVQGLAAGETLTETFTYTITDGDGDTSSTTLTIIINGADDGVTINGLDSEGPELIVDEDDLSDGSSPDAAALTQGGTFDVSTPDGLGNVTVGGVQVVANGVFTPATVTSPLGTVNITGFTPVTGADGSVIGGTFTYDYVLTDNTLTHGANGEDSVTDSFDVVVTDSDGSTANASLDVRIIDDVPTAADDVDSVTEDSGSGDNPPAADGNVLTGLGGGDANATDGVADTQGADGAMVTAVAGGSLGQAFAGAYGALTLNADGSYNYVLNNQAQPVQGLSAGETLTETFTYTITDGDGDASTATLTITINGADDGVTINGLNAEGAEVIVNEDDLSDGSSPNAAALTQTNNFTVSTPDGLGNVTIGGTQVVTNGVFTAGTATSPLGTVNITGFTPVTGADGSVTGGTFTYNYVLSDNTLTHSSQGEDLVGDSFAVVVTDSDGSAANASLDVRIIDDVPTAANDGTTQTVENAPVTIDVLANDVRGADGVQPSAVQLVAGSLSGTGTLVNNGDGSFTYTPGAQETGAVSFQYRITDGDGDTSLATATITLVADSAPQIRTPVNVTVDEDGLAGANVDNGLPGEVASTNSASANGTIIVNFGSDVPATLAGSLILNDSAALDTHLTVGGVAVTFAKVGNDLVGSVAGNEVIRISLTTAAAGPGATEVTYGYTVTLSQAIDQAVPGSEDSDFLAGIGFTVTDSDGTQSSGAFGVTIVDDLPTLNVSDTPTTVVEGATANGTWTLDRGADGVNSVNVSFGAGSATLSLAPGSSVSIAQPTGTLTVNANGTFSFAAAGNQNNAANPSASFTLSAVDRDGDPTSDSLTIAITDGANPVSATPITLTVNEAALIDGSNPASLAEVASGNLSFTAGSDALSGFAFTGVAGLVANLDGAGTDIFWTLAPGGQTIIGSLTLGGPAAITISLTAPASIAPGATAAATVTVTLADNLPHALANAAQTQALGNVTVQATDTDGDVATGVVTVQVTDDAPTARADADNVTEDGPLTADGNVLTGSGGLDANATDGVADTRGADGASVTGVSFGATVGTVGAGLAGAYGTLTLNADGSYSYLLNNAAQPVQGLSAGQTLTEIFTYTITDSDGDPAATTLTITIDGANDGVTITGLDAVGAELFVDEDDLPARAGEPAGSDTTPDSLTDSDSFTVSTPDGMGNVVLTSFNGVPLGAPLTLVVANGTFTPQSVVTAYGTLNVTGFTSVTGADGSVIGGTFTYSYTLNDNRTDHPAAGEDNRNDSVGVTVTDIDGSTASATIDIRITDDVPTASAEANQNVAEGATLAGTLDFVQGADGAAVTQINGTTLVFGGDGFSQAIDIGAGTIKVKADGSYSFTADASVPGTGTASATYTVRDSDGDTATAPISFTITDANVPTAGQTLASVDDDALAGGNPASTIGDLADPNSDGDNDQATFSGLLNLNFGGDGAGSVNFAAISGQFVTVGQESVQVVWDALTNTLTGAGPRGPLFTVQVTNPATGAYKVTLLDNVLHNAGGNENDAIVNLGFTVTDSDGSFANGSLQITFDDDAPTVVANLTQPTLTVDESTLGTDASASFASVFTPTFGADGAGANPTTYALGFTAGSTGLVDSLTNQAVVLSVVGGVVQGRTATSNELVFTVSVAANGAVTLDQARAVIHTPNSGPDQPTGLATDNLITLTATITDADGDTATATANIGQNLVFEDDAPVANDDTAGLAEGGPISVTFDVDTNDSDGADGFGSRTFTSLTGTYGTITINGNGTQTYALNAAGQTAINALAPGATLTDSFTYTLTDKDGDSDPATLVVTLTGTDDGVTITNLTPAANGGDVTVDEDDLPAGSDPVKESLTQAGNFNISAPDGVDDLTIGGQAVITNGVFAAVSFTTPFGNTLNITAYNAATGQISYTYTLTGAENHATGAGENSLFENFAVVLTDVDNDTANGILSVNIIDDVPDAVNDTDSIAAGQFGPATGNVITDTAAGDAGDADAGADTRGADGAAVSAIVSVNNGGGATTVGGGGATINGQYGSLTINTDGSYSYTRNAGTRGGVSDQFTYTLRDGDGDTDTATLTISIADAAPVTATNAAVLLDDDALLGGIAGGTGDDVNSQNTTGTLSGSGGDGALAYAFQTTGAPAGFVYELSGSNLLVKQGGVTVLTVTLNTANGAYTVTQNAPIIHPAGLDENNQPFTLNYSVTDIDGDAAGGTLSVNVDDDTPTVGLTAVNEGSVLLTTQDAETIGAVSDSAVSTANFGGVFTLTSGYGADGAGTTTVGYALALVGANGTDSTLDSNGASIFLYTGTGGTVVGSTSATAGGVSAANTIFSLGVNPATGVVTLTQFAEIDHAPNSDTSVPYDDQFASLANGLVRLNGTATITDADGDSQTSTAFVDLGGNIRFADDGPSIAAGTPLPTLTVDESNFGVNAVGAAVFTTNFGADGPGTVTYALGINAGSTGLVDTLTGQNVVLTLVGGQVVATAGVGGPTVFTVAVDAGGNITLDQIRAIAHDTDGGPGAAHDDAKTLASANLVTITGTITDGDGDSAQASINIGQRLTFKDDGPTTTADSGTTTEATLDFNAAFVLDFSGSIDNTELNTMLNAVRDAGLLLFANSSGDVSIRLVGFSSGAANLGVFTDPVSFVNAIDDLNPAQGGTRYANGNTDFTAGIEQLMDVFVPNPNASNQVFFLSDGNPNEQTGSGGNSLANSTRADWINFVNDGDVNVTAIGVGNGISIPRLQDVDVDGEGAPILAANFDDLVQTLLDVVVALPVTGDLDANDSFGGDGGRMQSIMINGTTYTWDGNNTITRTGSLTGNVSGNSITATTPNGAALSLNFATGIWSYAPPENPTVGSEVFNYSVVDRDGDTAGSTLTVTVADGGGPGGGSIALADMVITNASGGSGTAIQIAEAALLANDQAGTTISGAASNITDATSVTRGGGTFTFTDNDTDGGGFFYSTTPSDSARVSVNRAQAGENTLDGTSANDILIGRDANADTILAGDGNDYLYGLGGADTLTGGLGADTMTGGAGGDTFVINTGHSRAILGGSGNAGTISGFDRITDFDTAADILNLQGSPFAVGNTAGIDGTNSVLTIGSATIKSHAITNGLITFDDVNDFAGALTLTTDAHVAAAVDYLQRNDLGNGGATVAFVAGGRTFIYEQVENARSAANDILVELQGVSLTNLATLIGSRITPVTLDIDGDGLEFVSASAGAAFDYDGDGVREATSWVGSGDGILVRDANGDGIANNGGEIIFSVGGSTDLEGLRLQYDSNGDGKLSAEDAEFASFGVWQDVNGNGITDAGEFRSLTDLGIASIALASDGKPYVAGDGEVIVHGEASFTRADGTTGAVGDVAFITPRAANDVERTVGNQALTSSLVAASLIVAVQDAQPDSAAQPIVAADDESTIAQADGGVAAAPTDASAATTPTSGASDSVAETPATAAPDSSATLHSDDASPAAIDGAEDSGWRSETTDTADSGNSDSLADMIADRGSVEPGTMDGLLSLAAVPVEAAAVSSDAAAHDPAATAVLAEVLESSDSTVDQLIHAVTGGHEPVQIAASDAPAFDLAQFLDQKIAPDVAFPTSQPLEVDMHNMAAA